MFNFLCQRWGLSSKEGSVLIQLLLLAVTMLAYSVVAMAIANSLFVNYVGANSLPLAFILIGLCSIPAYGLFSTAIDRYSRSKLFCFVLVCSMAIAFGLRGLLNLDSVAVYYGLLIAIFFQWDFYNNILYPSLVIDYFSPLEYKRYAPFMGIAQAVGIMVGGGVTILLSHYLPTRDLLWSLPLFLAIAFWQVIYLDKSQPSLDLAESKERVGLIASITSFPHLARQYPLVLLLASSSFLLVIIYLSSEFLWFSLYSNSFSEEELTGFLGLMRILISLVQVGILYGVTRPLLQRFGVAKLNGVYPVTTLLSFGGLLLSLKLPAAIGLHINGDALYKGINLPIHQLNYNAIPSEFRGRVRTLSDGLIYSVGLTVAGLLLWVAHRYFSLGQITWLALGLTVLLLLVRLPMGKYYAQGLEQMIRADLIDLEALATDGIPLLPPQSQNTLREIFSTSDRYMQVKGLELAGYLGQLSDFLPEIKRILDDTDDEVRDTIVRLFATATDRDAKALFEELLKEKSLKAYTTAWELAINKEYALPEPKKNLGIQNQATATLVQHGNLATLTKEIKITSLGKQEQISLIRAVSYSKNAQAIPLLTKILSQASDEVKYQTLKALTNFATPQNEQLATIAVEQLCFKEGVTARDNAEGSPLTSLSEGEIWGDSVLRAKPDNFVTSQETLDVLIKITAWKIIELTHCLSVLSFLSIGEFRQEKLNYDQTEISQSPSLPHSQSFWHWGLADRDERVRQQVANSIAAYGELGLPLAKESLLSDNETVATTAIAALGKIGIKEARDILYEYLTPDFTLLKQTHQWQSQIDVCNPLWKPLIIAIADYQQRIIQKVLYILSCLGRSRTVNAIRQILVSNNEKDVANVLEVLASMKHRRFMMPLIPILEQQLKPPTINPDREAQWFNNKGLKILITALNSQDRWLKNAASLVLAELPRQILSDNEPLLPYAIAKEPGNQPSHYNLMNRLLLLKEVSLFKNLSLDELLAIEKALIPEQVLLNQTIYTEGSWGAYFYIIAEGIVELTKQVDGQTQEIKQVTPGKYFGEIALFDDAPRWDTAIAKSNCTLLKLEKKRFLSLISQRPHIILEICRFLSQRLRETDKYLSRRLPS
jgi:Cyclic nucleotide-binding domain